MAVKKTSSKKTSSTKTSTKKTSSKKTSSTKTAAAKKPATPDMTSLVDLSPEAVKALLKPRENFEEHVESLFQLYANHQEKLGALTVSVDEARARLERYKELAPGEEQARAEAEAANKKLEMIVETRAVQSASVWGVMMDVYGRAKQAAKKDPQIAAEIKAFTKFMATGPRTKAEPAPTK